MNNMRRVQVVQSTRVGAVRRKALSSRAAQTGIATWEERLTSHLQIALPRDITPNSTATLDMARKRVSAWGSLAVCAARDDTHFPTLLSVMGLFLKQGHYHPFTVVDLSPEHG